MALGRITYLDLTEEQRREGAARSRAQIKALLSNPALTADQRKALQDRLAHLRLWEAGKLPGPTNHVVQATETVTVKEKV